MLTVHQWRNNRHQQMPFEKTTIFLVFFYVQTCMCVDITRRLVMHPGPLQLVNAATLRTCHTARIWEVSVFTTLSLKRTEAVCCHQGRYHNFKSGETGVQILLRAKQNQRAQCSSLTLDMTWFRISDVVIRPRNCVCFGFALNFGVTMPS